MFLLQVFDYLLFKKIRIRSNDISVFGILIAPESRTFYLFFILSNMLRNHFVPNSLSEKYLEKYPFKVNRSNSLS